MQKENCEEILEIKDKTVVTIIKEVLKDGLKIQFNSVGEVTGKYFANHTETVDIIQKMDGTNEWQSRAVDNTRDGDMVIITGKGVGKMAGFQGEYTFMTTSKKLAWLNSTKTWAEGTADMQNGEATIKVYALNQTAEAPTPM